MTGTEPVWWDADLLLGRDPVFWVAAPAYILVAAAAAMVSPVTVVSERASERVSE